MIFSKQNTLRNVAAILIAGFLQACGIVGSVNRPETYTAAPIAADNNSIAGDTNIGDDDGKISSLLGYQVKLPKESRIAILKLSGNSNWRYYSNDFTELNDALITNLINKLRSSPRVYDASFLPAMLVPERRTVPVLREAAARFQADLLLGYRNSCRSFEKYRLLSANESKLYCSVEAILLDIRSGIIVKSVVSTEEYEALEQPNDTNYAETKKRAELDAVAKALGNIATEMVLYLDDVPVL